MGMMGHSEAAELLGAWALDACEPDEAVDVEHHLATCAECADEAARLRRVAGWLGADVAEAPPRSLRDSVLGLATGRRAPRAMLATPGGLLCEQLDRLDALVASFDAADWQAVTATGWTTQDFVAHLLAGESLINRRLGMLGDDPVGGEDDWDLRSLTVVDEHRGLPPAATVAAWRAQADLLRRFVATAGPDEPARTIPWFDAEVAVDEVLTIHGFEVWIHADDLRRAVGLHPLPPPAPHLRLMSELAVNLVELAMRSTGAHVGRTARVVLTGDGGGDWTFALDGGRVGPPDTVVTADVVAFCTLVGGRLAPAALACHVDGDAELAAVLVDTAAGFAFL